MFTANTYIDCQKYNFSWFNVSHALSVPFGHLITVQGINGIFTCTFGNNFYVFVLCTSTLKLDLT